MANIDYEKEMVGTVDVPEADKLDEAALTAWFEANVEDFAGPLSLSKFKGGQSNPTYKVATANRNYVLRRQPFGKLLPSAHAVDREYTVMSALGPTGFPVPRTFGLCEDADVIGSKFFVMELIQGRNLWNGSLPDYTPDQRREIYHAMVDTLADLHATDPRKIGLGDYGKPQDYCARQIARWTKQYKLSETEEIPEMEALIAWLPETVPDQHASGIVHGDYRLGNMLSLTDGSISAVLDWELCTLGDTLADVGYLLNHWPQPEDPDDAVGPTAAGGFPSRSELLRRYAERTGHVLENVDYYRSFQIWRLAAIVEGVAARYQKGVMGDANADIRGFQVVVERLARQSIALVRTLD